VTDIGHVTSCVIIIIIIIIIMAPKCPIMDMSLFHPGDITAY
jgi:hypothetical protein